MGDEIMIRLKMCAGFSSSAMSQRRAFIALGLNTQCQNLSVSVINKIGVVFRVNAALVAKNIIKLATLLLHFSSLMNSASVT